MQIELFDDFRMEIDSLNEIRGWIEKLASSQKRLYYRDQSPESLSALVNLVCRYKPSKIVELGTLSGLSLRAWLLAKKNAQIDAEIIAIDRSFKSLLGSCAVVPLELSKVRFLEQDILKTDFGRLWSEEDRVILYVDAHDTPNAPITAHVLNNAVPALPRSHVIAVDDLWYCSEQVSERSISEFFKQVVAKEIDYLGCFEGHYAPYWKGGFFIGFPEVVPLMEWVNRSKVDLIFEPGGKVVTFECPAGPANAAGEGFDSEGFNRLTGNLHHNPVDQIRIYEEKDVAAGQQAGALCRCAIELFAASRIEEALACLNRAAGLTSNISGAFYGMGVCLVRLGRFDLAVKMLECEVNSRFAHPNARILYEDVKNHAAGEQSRISKQARQGQLKGFTIFAMPKAFAGLFATIQRNAMESWVQLRPSPEIILLGDDDGVADAARRYGCRHIPKVERNEFGTPLLDDIFQKAQAAASNEICVYVNADIILMDDFAEAIESVARRFNQFLMVGRRWDVDISQEIDFGAEDWQQRLMEQVRRQGAYHAPTGIDYFAFKKGLWPKIPPLALGREVWDNWLVREALLAGRPVIDASGKVTIVHQNHDFSHVPGGKKARSFDIEVRRNLDLAGNDRSLAYTSHASWELTPTGIALRPISEFLKGDNLSAALKCIESAYQQAPEIVAGQCEALGRQMDAGLRANLLSAAKREVVLGSAKNAAKLLLGCLEMENRPAAENPVEKELRFSFVMIVLNGMPFIEYSLRSVYDFAHEIIIVEGAVENCMFAAGPDGSSTDGTVEFIKSFPDPRKKVRLIQGRWPEKCEMQNEALKYVTGDYVWLIDSDEVYKREHLEKVNEVLKNDPSITQVNFIPDSFWKGFDYIFVSSKFFEAWCHYRRLFKYVPGAMFTTHRPPTMVWPGCEKTTEQMHLLDGTATRERGIILYHYSYVLDKQVKQKIELYHRYGWGRHWNLDLGKWYEDCFLKWTPENRQQIDSQYPIWTGDINSRTQLFTGTHPEVMRDFVERNSCGQAVKQQTSSVSPERAVVRAQSSVSDPMERLRRRPQYLKIETTNRCNANCAFCAYRFMQRKKGAMSMDLFRKVIDYYVAAGGGALTMSPLVGDCLVDAKFLERLRYCRSFNDITHIGFHTNHIALSRWTDEQILEILDLVDVWNCSIGPNRDVYRDMFGVDKFEEVVANLERLNRLISVSEHRPLIQLNGRAAAGTCEEDERLKSLSSTLAGRKIHWTKSYCDWGGLLGDLPRNTPIEKAGGLDEKRLPCMKSLISAVVFQDGRVGFCGCADFDALLTIGDVNKKKLGNILAGEERLRLLESFGKPWLNEYCCKCSFYEPMNLEWISQWIEGTNPYHPEPVRASLERRRGHLVGSSAEKLRQCAYQPANAAAFPNAPPVTPKVKSVLWIRTDSIGDGVLSASMLPYIRRKYEGARIVVVCQEHIGELYEACPYVDEVVVFNRARALEDERYRLEITARLRMLKPQLSLNSVYSREALTDWFAIKCGAERRVALEGNLCNISPQRRSMHNQFYTDLLPSPGGHKLELERHRDFLKGLGIEAPGLQPVVWMKQEDEAFADRLFGENGLDPARTIALFAGAQYDCRVYEGYGRAMSEFCRANRLTVIALGTEQDRDINQRNLDAIGVRTINLSGRTTILQSCAILKRCRLAVGAETGLAHISCAVGTPNVILLGGGHFGRFMPYSPLTSVACLPLECYGCNWSCRYKSSHCVKNVATEVVAQTVQRSFEDSSQKIRVFTQGNSLWEARAERPKWKTFEQFLQSDNIQIVPVEGRNNATAPGRDSLDIRTPQQEGLPDAGRRSDVETQPDARLTIATSIAPKEIEKQARAVESWVKLGFRPVSINCIEEIDALRESFPQVEFVPAKRDAREVFGKPLIYFDDFLEYFRHGDFEFGGIVNSDIFLTGDEGIIPFIESQARDSLVYGSRINVDSLEVLEGEVYEQGFDFFFFHKSLIPRIPKTEFCIGATWWDYWAPLIAALEGFQIKRFVGPFAYHVRHRFRWDHKQWISLAQKCFAYLIDKASENFYEDPDTNPWALLAKIFYTNHNGDTRWSGRNDKMLPGVFFNSILEFLGEKSLRIGYAGNRPPVRRDGAEPVKKKRDIFIHTTDSAIQCAAPRASRQAPRAPGGGADGPGVDEREKQCDLSIVLCTKDRAELLNEMLDSLEEAAAGAAYELIVVKGGSRDNTLDVLRKHGVKEVYSESEWLGPQRHSWPQLYNFGFSKARGKWAMYASDDIVFGPGAVTRALEVLKRQKEDVAGGIFFYRNPRPTRQDWAEYGIDFTDGARLLMNYGLVRLESFRRVGGFDEAYRFYCADTDLCHKLYEAGWQLIPLPGCFVTHNDLLDAQKQANADASGRDMELCRRRWSHFIRGDTAVPMRLLWRDDLSEAFDVPTDLEKIDSGSGPRGGIESFWRGLACFQQGMFGRAEQEFVEAVKSFCDHKQVLWYLAQAADKCHDRALAEKAAVGVVRLAPDFEPGLELLVRVTGRQFSGDSAVPVLCSAQSGSADTVNSYACEPAFEMSREEGSLYSESWKAADLTNQASPAAAAMVRTPRRSDAVRSETELRRKLEKFNKVVVWGLKTGGHTHAHIHRHFFNTLKKLDAKVVLVDDLLENKDAIEGSDLVISVDVASRYLPIRQGVYYCLHNCEDDIHQRIDPSKNIRLRTYTRSAEQAREKWDQVTFFDGKTRTLFQPWATDLLASEFEEPILIPPSNIVFWVGSIWSDRLNRGNINEIRILKDALAKRDIRFVHLQGISDLLNVRYVRRSLIAPAIAGRWQVENDYLPCRMWKNISYGQLGVSNVGKFDEVFNDCTVTGRSIEEIIDNTLSLPFGRYRDMICEQQEVVKSHHTYVNRLLNIIRAFESVENC